MVLPNICSTPTPVELVIFDCDGVLVDSEVLSERVLLSMLSELGVEVSDDYFNTHFLGHSYEHVCAKILTDFSVALPPEFRQHYQYELMQVFSAELKPTQHLESMLSLLQVPFCLASSSSPQRVKRALEITELANYFSGRMFTCSQVKRGKPAPDLFLYAAQKMGVEAKNCLVIEDSKAGIQAALAADMQIVHYVGASHLSRLQPAGNEAAYDVTVIRHWNELFGLFPSIAEKVN